MRNNTFSVIAQHELLRMQDSCKDSHLDGDQKVAQLKELNAKRTQHWGDTIENKRRMKDEGRFERFKGEELERRRIDDEEQQYQQKVRQEVIKHSNHQIYESNPRTREFQSKLMLSDALQEREMQARVTRRIEAIDHQREANYLEMQRQKEREMVVKDQQLANHHKGLVQEFREGIKEQHNDMVTKYIKNMNEDKIENEIIKQRAAEERAENEQKAARQRQECVRTEQERKKDVSVRKTILQQMEDKKTEEYNKELDWIKRKDNLAILKNTRDTGRMNSNQKELKKLYTRQMTGLNHIKDSDTYEQKRDDEMQKLFEKQDQMAREKEERLSKLDAINREQRLFSVKCKQAQKAQEVADNKHYMASWLDQKKRIEQMDQETNDKKASERKDLQRFHSQQIKHRDDMREQEVRHEIDEAERIKTFLELEDQHFKSWAQQAISEWDSEGKNLKPMLLTLKKGMK